MLRNTLLAVAAVAVIVAALGFYLNLPQPVSAGQAMRLPVDPAPLVASTSTGTHSFSVEIADDPSERSAGLMFRESMDDDRGMLFVFEQSRPVRFWMKNTPMPLDLVFIGADRKVSEASIGPDEPVRFVLELKRGTAEQVGIRRGDKLDHPVMGVAGTPGG